MTAVLLDRLPHHAFIVHCNGEREPDFGVTSVNEGALRYRTATVIVGHNHPGGLPEPSDNDDTVTGEIGKALITVGITLRSTSSLPLKAFSAIGKRVGSTALADKRK